MTTITITPQLKVTMLKHLVAGKDLDFVAAVTKVPRDDVLDIVSKHGYPDVKKMAWAVDVLTDNDGNKIPIREVDHRPHVLLDTTVPGGVPTMSNFAGPRPNNPFAITPPATIAHIPPATADLLHQAEQSPFIRTQNIGTKISTLLADLTTRLNDEQAAVEAKASADREAARIATRIATLQAEINKLKRRPVKTVTTTTGPRPAAPNRNMHPGVHPCTVAGCARTFDTAQGVHLHQRRAHDGYNPNAAAS
jgi:hypothetical protein